MTDIIAAAVMMAGLYKLSGVNASFKLAYYTSVIFTVYSLPELIFFSLDLFGIYENTALISYLRIGQCVIACALTVLILKGLGEVAREVELERIPKRAERLTYATFGVYLLWIICNAPFLGSMLGKYTAVLYLVAIISLFVLVFYNLRTIYGCYMRICMPGEENGKGGKNGKKK